jgi:hypothetical protein
MFWISFGARNLIGCVICSSSFSALLISVSRSSFRGSSFGLDVFSKCPAKVFSVFLSLQAQVWSALPIGGMRCIGCFNRLLAFQSE